MIYKFSLKKFILLSLVLPLTSCISDKPAPDIIYSDNYTTTVDSEQKGLPDNIELNRSDAVSIAMAENPGYQAQQDKAEAAKNRYYSSLSKLAPATTISGTGVSTTYTGSVPETMNVLSEEAKSKEAGYSAENYARKLREDVQTTYNNMERDRGIIGTEIANEGFQRQMAENALKKYKKGQVSASDVLNFQIKANMAKAAAIDTQRRYGSASFDLASKMGMTTAQLPVNSSPSRKIGNAVQ